MHDVAAFIAALAMLTTAFASTEALVRTEPASKVQYERIEFLTTSPSVWVRDSPPDQGRYLRFVLYTRIEENPQEMRIESWTYGDEGCCERLVRSREFTLESALGKAFKSGPSVKCDHYFKFLGWVSLTSFRFSHDCKRFIALDVHKEVIRIREAQ